MRSNARDWVFCGRGCLYVHKQPLTWCGDKEARYE